MATPATRGAGEASIHEHLFGDAAWANRSRGSVTTTSSASTSTNTDPFPPFTSSTSFVTPLSNSFAPPRASNQSQYTFSNSQSSRRPSLSLAIDSVPDARPKLHRRDSSYTSDTPSSASSSRSTGAHKRTTSARRARAENTPYPLADPASHEEDEQLSNLMAGAGMGTDELEPWGSSRSSRSNSASLDGSEWTPFDDQDDAMDGNGSGLFSPADLEGERFDDFKPGQVGLATQEWPNDEWALKMAHDELDLATNQTRTAVTSSQKDKAAVVFAAKWLDVSYTSDPEASVGRMELYASYAEVCGTYGVRTINAASFGKAVRGRFTHIKTRRLGQRGSSRYHYCGLVPSNSEEWNRIQRFLTQGIPKAQKATPPPLFAVVPALAEYNQTRDAKARSDGLEQHASQLRRQVSAPAGLASQPATPTTATLPHHQSTHRRDLRSLSISVPQRSSLNDSGEKTLGGKTAIPPPEVLLPPTFPRIVDLYPLVLTEELIGVASKFWEQFEAHCLTLLRAMRAHRIDHFELNLRTWWPSLSNDAVQLLQHPGVAQLVYTAETTVYDDILGFLHDNLFISMTPQVFESLRSLADHMEQIQAIALAPFEGTLFGGPKVELAARFAHLLSRHLGLCQLAQALTTLLGNAATLNEMLGAWDEIDLEAVKSQSALVCGCDIELLTACFAAFRDLLGTPGCHSSDLIAWADETFSRGLEKQISSRSLLTRWSFVSGQVMRDLTLRSDKMFGSFQIFALFLEDYIGFQVLRRVALSPNALSNTPAPLSISPELNMTSHPANYSLSISPSTQNSSTFSVLDALSHPSTAQYTSQEILEPHPLDQFSPNTRRLFEEANAPTIDLGRHLVSTGLTIPFEDYSTTTSESHHLRNGSVEEEIYSYPPTVFGTQDEGVVQWDVLHVGGGSGSAGASHGGVL